MIVCVGGGNVLAESGEEHGGVVLGITMLAGVLTRGVVR